MVSSLKSCVQVQSRLALSHLKRLKEWRVQYMDNIMREVVQKRNDVENNDQDLEIFKLTLTINHPDSLSAVLPAAPSFL